MGVTLSATVGLASAAAYLVVVWLPRADPTVIEWPQLLTIAAPPVAVAVLLRQRPSAFRFAVAGCGAAVGFASAYLGALVWFVATSN